MCFCLKKDIKSFGNDGAIYIGRGKDNVGGSYVKITSKDITVALMGCVVNGPGEAREADIGIAGGKGEGLLFKKGEIVRKIPEGELVTELIREIKMM